MLKGKKIAVLGLGVSGFESARFLRAKGFEVFVSDQGSSALITERAGALAGMGISVETGRHSTERILECDWILISPGIPPTSSVYRAAEAKGIPILSEIEAASWFCPSKRVIAVTGSSGKTTVSTLLGRVFEKALGRTVVCGNIGNPWIGEISGLGAGDTVVLEVSSFQLMHCRTFRPETGILLNLSPNHQDWHRDMREYAAAKLRIFECQNSGDHAVLRRKDQESFFPGYAFKASRHYFGADPSLNPNEEVVRLAAGIYEVDPQMTEDVLRHFEGIEHRLEKVALLNGVQYINDSKCTTSASLAWALSKFPDKSVVLIAGGHPKSEDFAEVRDLVAAKVRYAVLIGEARPLLRRAWKDACRQSEANDFSGAVAEAHRVAAGGDTVLLSPACASFDMFRNYEERGRTFKALIRAFDPSREPDRAAPALVKD